GEPLKTSRYPKTLLRSPAGLHGSCGSIERSNSMSKAASCSRAIKQALNQMMLMKYMTGLLLGCFAILNLRAAPSTPEPRLLPPGVVNTQNPTDKPLSPDEALKRITVPAGFAVTLFAGEPDVMQPIAFDFDDRGRLWVVECFSYPDFKTQDGDRIVIYTDKDGDGRFDERKVFYDKGHRLSGIAVGFGGV